MAEYYGYAERDANAYVDWGKLGQNLTETVQTAYALREQKKKELDDLMQKNYAELANTPTGENQDINKFTTTLADNQKQYLLQVNKLLKAGILKPKDYTLINQNLAEDTKALFANAKGWQDAYAKILERNKNNTGSKAELDLSADVAAFGKFKNIDGMINPVTGRISVSKMITGPNGEQIKGESMSMQQLNVIMNQPIDKYNLTSKLSEQQEKLGEFITSSLTRGAIQKQGSIVNVSDKALKKTFEDAKNTFLNEVMANPFNAMSILVDHQGVIPGTTTPYRVSTNPADKGKPDVIFYNDPDGDGSYTPELTQAQSDAARDYATKQFIGMIDHKEEKKVVDEVSQTTEASAKYTKEQQRSAEIGRQMGLLVSGSDADKIKAASFFNNQRNEDGSYVFEEVTLDDNGKLRLRTKNTDTVYDISGNNKENSGMQVFSAFENAYGDGLYRNVFRNEMLNAGGKDVKLPTKGTRVVARSADRTTTTNTATGTGGSGKTVSDILGK